MEYEIRNISSLEDVSNLIKLHNITWNNSTGIIDLLENSTDAYILMEITSQKLAGYIFLEADKRNHFYEINDIAVDPEFRGQGCGKKMMNFVQSKYPFLKLNADSTNKDLVKFYKNFGFVTEARLENYYSIDRDALRMYWRKEEEAVLI